jgi:hypothetical protein
MQKRAIVTNVSIRQPGLQGVTSPKERRDEKLKLKRRTALKKKRRSEEKEKGNFRDRRDPQSLMTSVKPARGDPHILRQIYKEPVLSATPPSLYSYARYRWSIQLLCGVRV